MGRVKLKIKRLESASNRQVTYSKRRNGILKKAKELLILCDIDIILLMFSPTGKPTLFLGEHSNIEEVLAKIFQLTPQERAKRKLESLEALKKTFKKLDHDVNIHDFLGSSTHSVAELSTQVTMMQAQFMDVHKRLSCWSNAHKIDNIEHLRQLEDSLRESLNRILMEKESFVKPPRMPLECTSQFPHRMHLPLMMGGVQESQSVSWLHSNENQHMLLSSQPSFLPQRDAECSTYPSFSNCSDYFSPSKTAIENTRPVDNTGQDSGALNKLDAAACLRLQLNDQYPYQPYSSLDIPEAKKLNPESEMNLQGHPLDYHVDSSVQLPRPIFDNLNHTWVPTSEPFTISMFNDNPYSQQEK
ncbi:agamous-like MADS-box protein AGL65 isoform X1 [Actinidia eriantha]|uniref:agamous-like MADS-box protein AGL65 isoform X1 n=1 Tax=Actinidia eriantha TaxID=165200 RepID=UPI00258CE798|nr:agamous-like MADS-box protein AGL65 isoform X1 [Actinidia eriantha]XP_057479397.1 agamous-like MADS-box protein AGL65 isoform X1 [Actinidia eriantha]